MTKIGAFLHVPACHFDDFVGTAKSWQNTKRLCQQRHITREQQWMRQHKKKKKIIIIIKKFKKIGGGGREGKKKFRGQKYFFKCARSVHHFHAKIVKFELILTYEIFCGEKYPHAPCGTATGERHCLGPPSWKCMGKFTEWHGRATS